jgi:hypothetical protein
MYGHHHFRIPKSIRHGKFSEADGISERKMRELWLAHDLSSIPGYPVYPGVSLWQGTGVISRIRTAVII